MPVDLPAPSCSFASDNAAAVHPAILAALAAANHGHVLAYGDDEYTRRAVDQFQELFDRPVEVFFVWGGSGANVMALASMWRPAGAVICTDIAHINIDETASPERVVGVKLLDQPSVDGKLRAEQIETEAHRLGVQHHPQPCGVSITQTTECGTVYTPDEVAAIAVAARRHGMKLHMDGARIANAAAALGGTPEALRSFTVDAGVDVISFGGTKNGMMYGEAVVIVDPELARYAPYVRKQVGQLPSKMRYVAAQFSALLTDGLWLSSAGHANEMARRLHRAVADVAGITVPAPSANSLFPTIEPTAADELRAWCPFYDWDPSVRQYRWMTAWDTQPDDVDRFAAGVRSVLGR